MVSVIIPVYNTEPYLEECFCSVANQSYRDLQIIIINDGSMDGSDAICRKWEKEDARIRYIKKKNEGQGAARNLGIQMAEGEYIMFVDSDDYLDSGLVEQARRRMAEQNADICVFPNRYVGSMEKEWPLEYKTREAASMKDGGEPLGRLVPLLCNKMFSAKLVKSSGVRMQNRMCEDLMFNTQMYVRAARICYLDEPFYNYRYQREGNLSTEYSRYYEVEESVEELLENLEQDGYLESYRMQMYEVSFNIFKDILFRLSKREDLKIPVRVKAQYPIFFNAYKNCLNKWFSSWLDIGLQDKTYLLAGSYNLRVILHAMLLNEDRVKEDYGSSSMISMMSYPAGKEAIASPTGLRNAYRERCVVQDMNKTFYKKKDAGEIDYIVIDLLEEINDLVQLDDGCYITDSAFLQEYQRDDLKQYRRIPFLCEERRVLFIRYLKDFAKKVRNLHFSSMIIVKNFLCERYAVYYDTYEAYGHTDRIRKINRELEWCYEKLSEYLPDAVVTDASGFQHLVFTHGEFPFGCEPFYYNQGYYQKMAIMISRSVHDKDLAVQTGEREKLEHV